MAITEAAITSGNATAATSATTASVTPTANLLQLLWVTSNTATGTPNTPTVTGDGLTWAVAASGGASATAVMGTGRIRGTLFQALGPSTSTGTLTIDFAGQTQAGIQWSWAEFNGVALSGSNGADAVRQVAGTTGTGTAMARAQVNPVKSNSGAYGAFAMSGNVTATPGLTNEIHDNASVTLGGMETEWQATPAARVTATASGSSNWVAFAVELRDANDLNNDARIPVIASTSSNKTGNMSTDITVTLSSDGPSTPNASNAPTAGDLYIVSVEQAGTTANTCATPSGFTVGPSSVAGGATHHGFFTFYKEMNGTETTIAIDGSPSQAGSGLVVEVVRIAAGTWDKTLITSSTAAQTSVATNISIAGVTTTIQDALVLYFHGSTSATVATSSPTNNLLEAWDFGTDPGTAAMQSMASIIQATIGASGSNTFTTDGGGSTLHDGVCIAIQPPRAGLFFGTN